MRQRGIVMDNSQRFQAGDALAIDLGVTLLILAFEALNPLVRRLQGIMRAVKASQAKTGCSFGVALIQLFIWRA